MPGEQVAGADELSPHELGLEVRWQEPEKGLAVARVEVRQAALVCRRRLVGMGRAVDEGQFAHEQQVGSGVERCAANVSLEKNTVKMRDRRALT